MRTYRLIFSSNSEVFARRLKKAVDSESERLLCVGFLGAPPRERCPHGVVWAWEGGVEQVPPLGWDEYHGIVIGPEQLRLCAAGKFDSVVISPQRYQHKKHWLEEMHTYFRSAEKKNVFVEFKPWTPEHCDYFTIHEIADFLKEIGDQFGGWSPRPRLGIDIYDQRIPDNFALEASETTCFDVGIEAQTPKISVIIPTYNCKYFLHSVLFHLGQQNLEHEKFEVIIVDDGGSDLTWEYLQTFGLPEHLQVRYIYWSRPSERKRGDTFFRAGLCRNLGVRYARGESVVFLDSDMIVPQDFLSTVINGLAGADVIQFPRAHIKQEKSTGYTRLNKIQDNDCYIEEEKYWAPFFETKDWMSLDSFWKYTCTYGLAMRKSDFFKAGRFGRTYVSYGFEDTELGYRLAHLGKKFKLVPLRLFHLTAYSSSEYQFSKLRRHVLLKRTAKKFFLNTLDLKVYWHLLSFMGGENAGYYRIKKALCGSRKNRFFFLAHTNDFSP